MKKRTLHAALLAVLLLPAVAFTFGGWAVITVDDLPEYVTAGKQMDIGFVIRQHGVTPVSGLSPRVTMKTGYAEVAAMARPVGNTGHYVASLTAPRAGDYAVRIQSGFGPSENTLLPMRAIAVGAQLPRPLADADRGHRLFFAKGCVTCHVRGTEGTDGIKAGPDLTGRRYPPDYVATFLADPEKSPLSKSNTTTTRMPKLDLKDREIASLVAFINSEGPVAEVYVVGGAVMCIALDARGATRDVDAVFKPAKLVREAGSPVAAIADVPENWLNDAVKRYLSQRGDFDPFLELSHLRVFIAQPSYLLAMKCMAMRLSEEFHDLDDVRYLLRYLNITSAAEALAVVTAYYDEAQIPLRTRLALEELLAPS